MSEQNAASTGIDGSAIGSARWILRVRDLEANLNFFRDRLGFRLESLQPAESPTRATMSGYGLLLGLRQDDRDDAPTLQLSLRDPSSPDLAAMIAPNGSRIEFVTDRPALELPADDPEFVLSRLDDDASWTLGRAGMRYRDLIPHRQGGRYIASHIQITDAGPVADYVHYHRVLFQLIYCRRGWARLVYEAQGEPFMMHAGDCVLQPPQIRHRVLESGDELEVIEISCPAEHETLADHDLTLPDDEIDPEREFGGQRFQFHRAEAAVWRPWRLEGFECRDLGIAEASGGVVTGHVVRSHGRASTKAMVQESEFLLLYVLSGRARLDTSIAGNHRIAADDCVVVPTGESYSFAESDDALEFLEIRANALEAADPIELPIDGTLDLHNFNPSEVKDLVPEYLRECKARGISSVRIVHGKGTGALRAMVHSILERAPEVESFRLAGGDGGSWGATLVELS